jgi:apolipoprotein N-acyltransferase
MEEGLPVVRSTPTGISAVISADGTLLATLPYQQAGALSAPLPPARAPTLFARFGNILPLGFALILGLLAIATRRALR